MCRGLVATCFLRIRTVRCERLLRAGRLSNSRSALGVCDVVACGWCDHRPRSRETVSSPSTGPGRRACRMGHRDRRTRPLVDPVRASEAIEPSPLVVCVAVRGPVAAAALRGRCCHLAGPSVVQLAGVLGRYFRHVRLWRGRSCGYVRSPAPVQTRRRYWPRAGVCRGVEHECLAAGLAAARGTDPTDHGPADRLDRVTFRSRRCCLDGWHLLWGRPS